MAKTSSPKIYGVLGYPAKHSLSPVMHNAAFRSLKINAEYRVFEIPPKELNIFLEELPDKIAGCNVTIPHKIAVYDFISKNGETLTDEAKKIGAVNTIIVKKSSLTGDNTDGKGFMKSLKKDLSFNPKDKTICIVGAGGAARSIIMQLGNLPKKIYVFGIILKQLRELRDKYKEYYDKRKIECHMGGRRSRMPFVRKSDLFINATPIGMEHMKGCVIEKDALHDNLVVYDVIYHPPETKLLALAKEKGIQYSNGLGMLLYQGMLSFEKWTGKNAPQEVMRQALQKEINKRRI